ncbi:hypothetical protein [Paenibacillus senegalensis]|uniref:hypothetical protein n=1 Tax=Paenibacillus senegalensis TaxID=1465766 RepID=UPI000287CE7C|nr:hypothetical protein [Paenibacillus senegalensis]
MKVAGYGTAGFAAIITLLLLFVISGNKSSLPGEGFIIRNMINSNGTLKTNLLPGESTDQDLARGEQSLSESLGLWLLYWVESGNQQRFDDNLMVLRRHFLNEGWIAWKAEAGVTTNALVDDLRAAEALYAAYDRWGETKYLQLANGIARTLQENQYVDGSYRDFYDIEHNWTSPGLTLSYFNLNALRQMTEHSVIAEEQYREAMDFLRQLPVRGRFFPVYHDALQKEYRYADEINLIDQLYIAYHRAQLGMDAEPLWTFIKEQFQQRGLLYGRYDAETELPTVAYESPAVYGLAVWIALEQGEADFARELYDRMVRLQSLSPFNRKSYGGYMNNNDTHIFDNLVPLLAERRMYNEGLLR